MHSKLVSPEHNREHAHPEIEVQKAGSESSREPQTARKYVLLDLYLVSCSFPVD